MSGDVAAEVAAELAEHLWNGCTDPACDPGSDPEVCVRRPFLNHLSERITDALAPLIAERVGAAKAEALRDAARFFENEMAPAWGSDLQWLSTGNHVAELAAGILRDHADQIGGDA